MDRGEALHIMKEQITRAAMTITLEPQLEAKLAEAARDQGTTPEALANAILRDRFQSSDPRLEPQDEWERRLFSIATDCGVSLSSEAIGRESLYE